MYKVDNIFYRQINFGAEDNETGIVNTDAIDLLSADLAEIDVPFFTHTTSVQDMLSALLADTIFTAGVCDDLGIKYIAEKNTNKMAVLNKILELFKGELEINLLTVSIKNKLTHYVGGDNTNQPFKLTKGKNILTLSENIDTSTVITKLRYMDSNANTQDAIASTYINNYPIPKEAYKEFKGDADIQAQGYLEANELPRISYNVSVPYNFKHGFKLGTVVEVYCEQIGINIQTRVVELTRDLTGQTGDSYTLGQKPKSFTEWAVDLYDKANEDFDFEELEEWLEEWLEEEFEDWLEDWLDDWLEEELDDIIDDKIELIIPEIVDEVYERIEFPEYPDPSEFEFPEAPEDGKVYGRSNAGWVEIEPESGGSECECNCEGGNNGGGGAGGGFIIIDHVPTTQTEVDTFPMNGAVLVYDPNSPLSVS